MALCGPILLETLRLCAILVPFHAGQEACQPLERLLLFITLSVWYSSQNSPVVLPIKDIISHLSPFSFSQPIASTSSECFPSSQQNSYTRVAHATGHIKLMHFNYYLRVLVKGLIFFFNFLYSLRIESWIKRILYKTLQCSFYIVIFIFY